MFFMFFILSIFNGLIVFIVVFVLARKNMLTRNQTGKSEAIAEPMRVFQTRKQID